MAHWWSDPTSKHAFNLSWISVIITVFAAGGGLAIYEITGSSLILCYGLENCVDFFSSVVVLWRFFCPELNPEVEARLRSREKRASILISIILGILGVGIIVAAADDFMNGMEEPEKLGIVLGISVVSILIFGLLAVFKFHYSILLQSASLHKDGICSLIGTTLSAALFINTLIVKHLPQAWWIDPAVALGCGIASVGIGLHAIIVASCIQKIPLYSLTWWSGTEVDDPPKLAPDASKISEVV
mmetsp:Transcript_7279/g.10414  ORF Transcript_7279/g.10414 Transcript_7279/m.10414 type:complete len:243 (+) Transcript_7279:587-1315(+)|eukprot:CAMPEP_0202448312 /NCGR_PEP_ID=MMETSP1360-20130828/7140_1 /ASSEMBLY_ACC=CAM_ASM_000848 /TAXON_ID=515479 /ORGANISM="Licmophora paradoxa, Strain CCMP2313" /LENGTH=242 /DNA_ID=CAMNT_0049065827 /DNA_START=612 /DNA_END=1340 /DNA_ORIENTATION=-